MNNDLVPLEQTGQIATVTINQPATLSAQTEDAGERLTAFSRKHKPDFKGQ